MAIENKPFLRKIEILLIVFFALHSFAFILFTSHEGDAGTHGYTAKLVYSGKCLYRDVFFAQGPLLPYFYGFFQKTILGFSVVTGRLITLLIGIITCLLIARTARRLEDEIASLVALGLICVNTAIIWDYSLFKTYPLSGLLFLASASVLASGLKNAVKNALALSLIGIAVSQRFTAALVWVLVFLYILLTQWGKWKDIVIGLIAGLLVIGAIFAPFLIICPDQFIHDVFIWQMTRSQATAFQIWDNRLTAWLFAARNYYIFAIISVLALVISIMSVRNKHDIPSFVKRNALYILLAAIIISISAGYMLIPKPTAPDYIVDVIPLACVFAGCAFSRIYRQIQHSLGKTVFFAMVATMVLYTPLITGNYYIDHWQMYLDFGKLPCIGYDNVISYVKANTQPRDKLLTFKAWIPLESGRELISGFEGAELSYHPHLDFYEVKKYRLVNDESIIRHLLAKDASLVIFSRDNILMLRSHKPYLREAAKPVFTDEQYAKYTVERILAAEYSLKNIIKDIYIFAPKK